MGELLREAVAVLCVGAGCLFYAAGTIGLLRFPDLFSCLHALSKADNVGLGLVVLGVALKFASWTLALKLGLIWVLVMFAGATAAHLVADRALRAGIEPWSKAEGDE
jgi:multicomponent Na+:H+ antiporter subunit G